MRIVIIFTERNVYHINEKCDVRVIINQDSFLAQFNRWPVWLSFLSFFLLFLFSIPIPLFTNFFPSHLNCDWWLLTSPHIFPCPLSVPDIHSRCSLKSNYGHQLQMRWKGATLCGIIWRNLEEADGSSRMKNEEFHTDGANSPAWHKCWA